MTPTAEQVEALASAMWQLLDDMGADGQSVCLAAKAIARVAFEPFWQGDDAAECPLDMSLAEAQRIVDDLN
jgi:hypothetical protein